MIIITVLKWLQDIPMRTKSGFRVYVDHTTINIRRAILDYRHNAHHKTKLSFATASWSCNLLTYTEAPVMHNSHSCFCATK